MVDDVYVDVRGFVHISFRSIVPDLDKTWDAQNYVLRELKSGRSPNHPCNSVGLGDGVILRKTEQFPSRFSFV